jgi:AraC-like DNA-binding protein
LSTRFETPFDSIENAQQYIRLLIEAVEESRGEINDDLQAATDQNLERRVQALRIVHYKLEKLQQHLGASSRTLNDLRSLRRLLLEERAAIQEKAS